MTNIVIYTKDICPYCNKAKSLFERKNLTFKEIKVTDEKIMEEEMLKKSNGARTVPQIFINEKHIGGCDDLYFLEESKELDKIL